MCYVADFETTTIEPAKIWAVGMCEIENIDKFVHFNNISEYINYCAKLKNPIIYFHNLKFDGEFIIYYLLKNNYKWVQTRNEMQDSTFTTLISDLGVFYSIEICLKKDVKGHRTKKITFYDSLKLINMPVRVIAKKFKLPILKGDIDYDRHNTECETTETELNYLKNDCQIVAMALKRLFELNLNKMTIGSSALADYKKDLTKNEFNIYFPQLDLQTDSEIRAAYKGGYTYCNPEKSGKDVGEGFVLDVNSLYPYVMSCKPLPFGTPLKFEGKYVNNSEYPLYIQNLRCFFKIKKNHIPTIQLKNNSSFCPTTYLTSSVNKNTGIDELVDLCLTSIDLDLFFEHYDVQCIEYINGYMFRSSVNLFSDWVHKWTAVKINGEKTGDFGMRTTAKLAQNNLYGKFSTNPLTRSKKPILLDNKIKYVDVLYNMTDSDGNPIVDENGNIMQCNTTVKDSLYIPIGAFITAHARYITISTSQKIHEESLKKYGFSNYCYSDTDSIHMLGNEIPNYINVDDTALGAWKVESHFKRARFIQAKRYIEDIIIDDDKTEMNVKCCGMPASCYKYVTWENFKIGETFEGKLVPKHVEGGIILEETTFKLKQKFI